MRVEARLAIIETKQKFLEKLIYGIYILLGANLGINIF